MLALGALAPLTLFLALLIDLVLDPARRVLPLLDRLLWIPGEGTDWFRRRSLATRRIIGWGVIGAAGLVGLVLLLRLQVFLIGLPFGDLLVAVAVAPFLPLRAVTRLLGMAASGLSGGNAGIARDALAALVPWRAVAQDPPEIARQVIETSVLGFCSGFLAPVLAFSVIGLPGPVLWRLLIGFGSFNPAHPDRDRQMARGADRSLMLLLYGPGWLGAWLFALAGRLAGVPVAATRTHLDYRVRHGEEPLAAPMDAMAFILDCPLARPVLVRTGADPGMLFNRDAAAADGAAVLSARRILRGAIGLVAGTLLLVCGLMLALIP